MDDSAQPAFGSDGGTLAMADFFQHPLAIAALWFAAILGLLALAIRLVRSLRGGAAKDRPSPSDMLSKFRDLHARGGLSDDEYRTIKTKLASEIEAELTSGEPASTDAAGNP